MTIEELYESLPEGGYFTLYSSIKGGTDDRWHIDLGNDDAGEYRSVRGDTLAEALDAARKALA